MSVGDLRFVLDIVRRISSVSNPVTPTETATDLEPLIETVLDAIEQIGGTTMLNQAIDDMEQSLPSTPPLRAMWRRIRSKRKNKPTKGNN